MIPVMNVCGAATAPPTADAPHDARTHVHCVATRARVHRAPLCRTSRLFVPAVDSALNLQYHAVHCHRYAMRPAKRNDHVDIRARWAVVTQVIVRNVYI
jgi:hypothetical protein